MDNQDKARYCTIVRDAEGQMHMLYGKDPVDLARKRRDFLKNNQKGGEDHGRSDSDDAQGD